MWIDAVEVFKIYEAQLPGDYNNDGTVDAADYTVWRDSLNSTTELAADGNRNGVIDTDDYNLWRDHFGESIVSSSNGVPEPSSLSLLSFLSLGFLLRNNSWRTIPTIGTGKN